MGASNLSAGIVKPRQFREFLGYGPTYDEPKVTVSIDSAGRLPLEQRQPGVRAMYVIGCGGNTNPYPRGLIFDTGLFASNVEDVVVAAVQQLCQRAGRTS